MDKKTSLTYLKGYLEAIAMMNSFANDGKTYLIDLLPKADNDAQKTLKKHLQPLISLELKEVEGLWKDILQKELEPYFDQIIVEVFHQALKGNMKNSDVSEIDSFKKGHFNIDNLIKNFLEHLEKLAPQTAKMYRVKVESEDFYENYYHDYLFDLEDEVLFLHFGSSD